MVAFHQELLTPKEKLLVSLRHIKQVTGSEECCLVLPSSYRWCLSLHKMVGNGFEKTDLSMEKSVAFHINVDDILISDLTVREIDLTGIVSDLPKTALVIKLPCKALYSVVCLTKCDVGKFESIQKHIVDIAYDVQLFTIYDDMTNERCVSNRDLIMSSLSHELYTPLNGILTSCKQLNDVSLKDEQRYHFDMIKKYNMHLIRIVNDITDLGLLTSGKFKLEESTVNVQDIANSTITIYKQKIILKGLKVSINFDPGVYVLWLDGGRLMQILINLISNSIQFTPDLGKIDVHFWKDDTFLWCSVKDNGFGIEESVVKSLFKPIYSDKSPTNGVGLMLVYHLVGFMGGHISCMSKIGQGTCFTFSVKLKKSQMLEDKTVAIVGSHPDNIKQDLKAMGAKTIHVHESDIVDLSPDLVVSSSECKTPFPVIRINGIPTRSEWDELISHTLKR